MNPVFVLNGPNLGRLGVRQPEVYGSQTYAELAALIAGHADRLGLMVDVRQTDDEATLVGWLHEAADNAAAVVINPAAFTHYSIAVRDAAAMVGVPLIEVHLSNIAAREEFRRHSVLSDIATGTIAGFGGQSYLLALDAVASLLAGDLDDA
ncbi:MAG: type II 3-dehydroquinate dehydratase [Actinomycetota bacterium]